MTDALEYTSSNVACEDGEDGRRRWRIADPHLPGLQLRQEAALEALDIAARKAEVEGRIHHAGALQPARRAARALSVR